MVVWWMHHPWQTRNGCERCGGFLTASTVHIKKYPINTTRHAAFYIYCRLHEEPSGVLSIVRPVLVAAPIVQASIPSGSMPRNAESQVFYGGMAKGDAGRFQWVGGAARILGGGHQSAFRGFSGDRHSPANPVVNP